MSDEHREVAHVTTGFLGWGNRKGGLEAYGVGGRWSKLNDGTPVAQRNGDVNREGDLLGDALDREGQTEGATLIVVSLPRFHAYGYDRVGVLRDAIEALLREWEVPVAPAEKMPKVGEPYA